MIDGCKDSVKQLERKVGISSRKVVKANSLRKREAARLSEETMLKNVKCFDLSCNLFVLLKVLKAQVLCFL